MTAPLLTIPMPESFEKLVEHAIYTHRLFEPGAHILVAVSGGPDSVALLHALWNGRERWSLGLTVAHLNHQLRDQASDEDAAFVTRLCASLNLPCVLETADTGPYCRQRRCSTETGARELRYAFLERVAQACGANRIATGHTADDQAETVLMRLVRGSGAAGLSGIRPAREQRIIRPLLYVTRDQVMAYLAARRLTIRKDATNDEPDVLRNHIRLRLLPLLQEAYNPEIRSALCRLAEILRDESDYLEEAVAGAFADSVTRGEASLVVNVATWLQIPVAIQRRLVRRMVEDVGENPERLSFDQIERTRDLISHGRVGSLIRLFGALTMERRRDTATLNRGEKQPFCVSVAVPGETELPGTDRRLVTSVITPAQIIAPEGPSCVYFDIDSLGESLVARSRRPGDRLAPLGMAGTKTLKALFSEWNIPRFERNLTPILASEAGILWIAGHRRSRLAPVSNGTRRVLKVTLN